MARSGGMVMAELAGCATYFIRHCASLVAQLVKNLSAVQANCRPVPFLGWEDPLNRGQATYSSLLGLPWCFRRSRIHLQCRRPGFNPWVGKVAWRRAWHHIQYSCLENPMDRGAWRLQSMGSQRVGHD